MTTAIQFPNVPIPAILTDDGRRVVRLRVAADVLGLTASALAQLARSGDIEYVELDPQEPSKNASLAIPLESVKRFWIERRGAFLARTALDARPPSPMSPEDISGQRLRAAWQVTHDVLAYAIEPSDGPSPSGQNTAGLQIRVIRLEAALEAIFALLGGSQEHR